MSEEATPMKTVEPMISSFIIVYIVAVVIIHVLVIFSSALRGTAWASIHFRFASYAIMESEYYVNILT